MSSGPYKVIRGVYILRTHGTRTGQKQTRYQILLYNLVPIQYVGHITTTRHRYSVLVNTLSIDALGI